MKRLSRVIGASAALAALAFAHAETPAARPEVFEPGVISGPAHDSAPAFSPDGREVYFTRSSSALSVIMVSHRLAQGWSKPAIASFSGEWLEMEPAFSPDGRFMIYASNRPDDGGTAPIDGFFNGVARPGKGARLWRVDRLPAGWSRPRLLPPEINDGRAIYAPSVTRDGSLYFMKPGADGRFQIFRAQADGAGFKAAERAPFNEAGAASVDPAVAPDESFVVFSSSRKPAHGMNLFIALRHGTGWDCAMPLGDTVGSSSSDAEARLSPDGRTLYFASDRTLGVTFPTTPQQTVAALQRMHDWDNGNYNIWRVSLAPWLARRDGAQACAVPATSAASSAASGG
jgi:Tol biopolymer transport system component